MKGWSKVSLSDLGDLSRGKSKHRPRNDKSLYGGDYPFIQTGDVKQANFYISEYSQTYSEKGLKQSKLWERDTLCITIAANIAESGLLEFPACFPDSIVGFIPYEGVSDVRYVKYLLDNYKSEFQKRSKGATQDNLSVNKMNSLKINVPEYKYQVRIADIISIYDELIENNQKRIKILEEMAQRLYAEWFVKFKFPGHEDVKMIDSGAEFGMIPEGWQLKALGEFINIKKGRNITKKTVRQGDVPVVAGGLKPAYFHDTANTLAPIITISASGANAGFVNLYHQNIWASDCSYIDINATKFVYYYYLFLKSRQREINNLQKGSAQPHVYPKDLQKLEIAVASCKLMEQFHDIVKNYFEQIKLLTEKETTLVLMRDLLIENLITGKRLLRN